MDASNKSNTVTGHVILLGSVPVSNMGSRPAKKDLAKRSGPKTFQRKVQMGLGRSH